MFKINTSHGLLSNFSIFPVFLSFLISLFVFNQINPSITFQNNLILLMIIISTLLSVIKFMKNKNFHNLFNSFLLGLAFSSLLVTIYSPLNIMRSVDFIFLIYSLIFFTSSIYRKDNYQEKLLLISVNLTLSLFVFNISGILFGLGGGWFQTTGFISILLFFIFSFFYIAKYSESISNFTIKQKIRYLFLSIFLGLWSLMIFTEQSDYGGVMTSLGWRNRISWSLLTLMNCSLAYFIINTSASKELYGKIYINTLRNLHLNILIPFLLSCILFYQTILTNHETEQYASYHLGLMNLLANHAVEFGIFSQCSSDHLSPNNVADLYASCWVYPTGWWNIGLWPLIILHWFGLDAIFYSKLITIVFQFCILYLLYSLSSRHVNDIAAIVVCIVYFSSSQIIFSSQIYAFQWPMIIWMLFFLKHWLPELSDSEEISKKNWLILLSGPFIFGHTVTVFVLGVFIFSFLGLKKSKFRLLYPFIGSIISSLVGLFVWIKVVDFYWEKGGGSSSQLWEKANKRSNQESFLFDIDYYIVIFERSSVLLESIMILGILFLLTYCLQKYAKKRNFEQNSMDDDLLLICSGFLVVFIYVVLFWPEAYFHHTYLTVLWLTIPGSISSVFLLKRSSDTINIIVVILLFSTILLHSPGYGNNGDDDDAFIATQEWMISEIEQEDNVLLSQDVYMNHLLAYYSGSNVFVRPVNSSGDYVKDWILSDQIDVIIISEKSWENWELEEFYFSDSWCYPNPDMTFKIPDSSYQAWHSVKIINRC